LRQGLRGLGGCPLPAVALDFDDRQPTRLQLGEVGALVLVALAPDQLGLRVVFRRPWDAGELERRQMLAGEEGGESRRRVHPRESCRGMNAELRSRSAGPSCAKWRPAKRSSCSRRHWPLIPVLIIEADATSRGFLGRIDRDRRTA
jgi:hypothetical protein